jgi:subtilisin family serine protease
MVGSPAYAVEGTVLGAGRPDAVAGSYIVVLKATSARASSTGLATKYGGTIGFTYTSALRGFSVKLTDRAARRLAADPAVAYVEQDAIVRLDATQTNPPSWGLDRIDQRNLPLNNSYTYPNTATNVHAYIIDTGIRFSHQTFGGRATSGFDAIDGGSADDCNGHGTHVAGTVGGSQYGVAKGVLLVGVRVLNCSGSGTIAQVVAGVDWVRTNAIRPAVANMSLGGGASTSIDNAVSNAITSGVTFAVAAGNSNANACNSSPARVPAAITVGATQINDARASFSNFGTCLDVFGPGVSITSSWSSSDTATNTISGTSMASPHAAGVAALIASANPAWTPQQVRDRLVADATPNVVTNPGTGSPNRLLFVPGATTPPPGTTVYSDTFETATGWTTNPNGTDTATTGRWERGDPEATSSSGVTLQLGTTVSGTNDLVTGRLAGAGAGADDVDSGTTSIQSPAITLPSTGTLTLSFSWYLAHLTNATSADFFRVSVVAGGGSTVVFSQTGAATNRAGAWATASTNLTAFAGQSIRLRVEAADASTASLIEAGVDDVRITQA